MRILVVEDDELIGTAIARALHDAAYVADWVVDAPSAMGALLGRDHDAVLLDLNLPEGDGLSILRDLPNRAPDTPPLLTTAPADSHHRTAALDSRPDPHL